MGQKGYPWYQSTEGISYYRGPDQVRPWDRKVNHDTRVLRGSPTIEDETRRDHGTERLSMVPGY